MTRRMTVLAAAWLLAGMGVAPGQESDSVDDRGVKVVAHVPLRYPQIARAARVEGLAVVAVSFDANGAVTDARVLSGWPILREAAAENVRRWTFAPSGQGRAVVVYDFQLSETCIDDQPPPPFTVRRTLASVYACAQTVQPQR